MVTRDQKEQVNGPRYEDEEVCLCCSAETSHQTQTTSPPLPPGHLKVGIRQSESCFRAHLLSVCAESKGCALEHLWLPQQKRRRLWLCQIIAPYHKRGSNRSDKEKHCYFQSTVQSNYSTLPKPQPDTFVTILFCENTVPAVSSTQCSDCTIQLFGLSSFGK